MESKEVKIQRRSTDAVINIPKLMVAGLPENCKRMSVVQYQPSGKLVYTPIVTTEDEKCY